MLLLQHLVEQRIAQAAAEGAFDNLPGQGQPLDLDDAPLVPEALRVAHRILKNAGYLPPEIADRREIAELGALMRYATTDGERRRAGARLALLCTRLEAAGRQGLADASAAGSSYATLVADRLDRVSERPESPSRP